MPPRVTVIMPTYNWSTVLPYSIGSVLRQTMADFELLVVGDGCTDDSESVVAGIGDPRVRWINLPANSGHQSTPNNEGLRQARGEIVAYLGHDDLWLPHHLAALVAALDSQADADIAYSLMALVGPEGSFVWPSMPRPKYGAWGMPSCTLHRRRVTEALGGWRDHRQINVEPDVDLWRRAHAAGFEFAFVPRLTSIKFPASWRRDVYRTRPCHEQAAWLARIDAEPDLEARLLVNLVVDSHESSRIPYRELVRKFFGETLIRFRRRLSQRSQWSVLLTRRRPGFLRDVRRFKGL